ncbi:hypothetical protein ACLOJK_023041 [Asimina triloba]
MKVAGSLRVEESWKDPIVRYIRYDTLLENWVEARALAHPNAHYVLDGDDLYRRTPTGETPFGLGHDLEAMIYAEIKHQEH